MRKLIAAGVVATGLTAGGGVANAMTYPSPIPTPQPYVLVCTTTWAHTFTGWHHVTSCHVVELGPTPIAVY